MKQIFAMFGKTFHRAFLSGVFLVVLVLATSCASGGEEIEEIISPPGIGETVPSQNQTPEEAASPVSTTSGDNAHMTPQIDPPTTRKIDDLVEKAIQDLSERLNIGRDEIVLVEAREVVWSNGSLGCPQPGMIYTDVLTPGYLIILNANNFNFEYHAGEKSEIFFCQNPEPPASGAPSDR